MTWPGRDETLSLGDLTLLLLVLLVPVVMVNGAVLGFMMAAHLG